MHKILPKFFIFIDKYENQIFKKNNINLGVIYRNYEVKKRDKELVKIVKACKKYGHQLFISNDIKLVLKFKADGLYIPSFNQRKYFLNLEKKNIRIIGSAHNQKEISIKITQRCSAIFLSPIFYINKKNTFLDIYRFNYLSYNNKINFYALGGISISNIKKIKLLKIYGFGGVSIFKKKPAYKRPVFIKNNFF